MCVIFFYILFVLIVDVREMTEYVYLGMNNFQMQDIRKLQNMVSELIKRTMDELNITRIRKNFLMCYYGL